jgi:succinoglycan biosynthesis transport protein ExoP
MDTKDRPEAYVSAGYSPASSRLPGTEPLPCLDVPNSIATGSKFRSLSGRVADRLLLILLLWLVISAPICFLIYQFIEPTYEATSLLRIDPAQQEIFGPINRQEIGNMTYLQTQLGMITSDKVLDSVLASPLVVNLPTIKKSQDPKNELRGKLRAWNIDGTNLIKVAMELPDAEEAVTLVKAVVQSYLTHNLDYSRSANRELMESLKKQLLAIGTEIKQKREDLKALVKNGRVAVLKQQPYVLGEERLAKDDGSTTQPTFKSYSEGHADKMMNELNQTDLQLIEAESLLDVKSNAYKLRQDLSREQNQDDGQRLALIEEQFRKDPEVVALKKEIDDTSERIELVKRGARQGGDAALVAARDHLGKLKNEYKELWNFKYVELLKELTGPFSDKQSLAAIQDLEQKLEQLKKKKEKQVELFKKLQIDRNLTNDDTFEAAYLSYQLSSLQNGEEQVKKNLVQLNFEANQDKYRVTLHDPAAASMTPSNNKRLKYMAAAPVGVMFMMLGLFLLLEISAERVADPDALSTRVRSEVYALPPLPTARSMRKLSESDADDQIEQFIQRLDHLRFAVCGNSAELGKGRCVLITSAIGGEVKTTLAAQLAARCGNAGMSTLLIDSDFRRAALCPLLDVPEGPGLSDVLKDEAAIDEAAIPVQGGAFYLLRAGTPIQDTSRLLQTPKFGQLIGQLRQRYDLIIIDSPPVLPVPDALILGRWADGAVIAARYDISRFPQVERARRQLDNAGIAILGTVINGMRHSDSYYGRYTYSRRRSSQPDSSNMI